MNLYFEIFIDKFIFSLFSIGSLLFELEFSKIYKMHSKSSSPTTHLTHLKFAFNSNPHRSAPILPTQRLVHRITIITRLSHSTLQKKKKETLPIPGKIERRKSWKRAFDTSIIDHVPQANWQESNGRVRKGELEAANVAKEAIGHTCGTITVRRVEPAFRISCEPKNVTAEPATRSTRVSSLAPQTSLRQRTRRNGANRALLTILTWRRYERECSACIEKFRALRGNRILDEKISWKRRDFWPLDGLALIEMQRW